MNRASILARIVFLCVVLLAFIVATNAFLSARLPHNSGAISEGTQALNVLTHATAARTHFGELKYWLSDLSVSLLMRSESNAMAARAALERDLDTLAPFAPEHVAVMPRCCAASSSWPRPGPAAARGCRDARPAADPAQFARSGGRSRPRKACRDRLCRCAVETRQAVAAAQCAGQSVCRKTDATQIHALRCHHGRAAAAVDPAGRRQRHQPEIRADDPHAPGLFVRRGRQRQGGTRGGGTADL